MRLLVISWMRMRAWAEQGAVPAFCSRGLSTLRPIRQSFDCICYFRDRRLGREECYAAPGSLPAQHSLLLRLSPLRSQSIPLLWKSFWRAASPHIRSYLRPCLTPVLRNYAAPIPPSLRGTRTFLVPSCRKGWGCSA